MYYYFKELYLYVCSIVAFVFYMTYASEMIPYNGNESIINYLVSDAQSSYLMFRSLRMPPSVWSCHVSFLSTTLWRFP